MRASYPKLSTSFIKVYQKQCLRYSFDPKSSLLMEQTATLFVHKRDRTKGLVLENIVPASMKDSEYNVRTAFTKKRFGSMPM